MARYVLVALALVFTGWAIEFAAAVVATRSEATIIRPGGLQMSLLAGPGELARAGNLNSDFDITSTGIVLLRGGNRLYGVEPGHHSPTDLGIARAPDSFAVDAKDVVLTVTGGFLGVLSARDNKPLMGVSPPYPGAHLARSVHDGTVYLFVRESDNYRLYRFMEDGASELLLETDEPIVAATDRSDGLFVATPTMIVEITKKKPLLLFKAPDDREWGPIVSLAASDQRIIFFSTPKKIFALKGGVALSIANDSGGSLRLRGERLYVLDPQRRLLYTLTPASMAMFSKS